MTGVDDQIRKKFGATAIRTLGETRREHVDVIPTGSLQFDLATDVGGIPCGRVTEIFGPEGSFKTSIALTAVAEAQKVGKRGLYIDIENALEPNFVGRLGVDIDSLSLSQPDSAEEAISIVEMVARSNEYGIIVLDSVASLSPQAELEGETGEMKMGLSARLMSQHMRKVKGIIHRNNIAVIYINQIRMKIGVVYGNPEVTTGGLALGFYASLRVRMSRKANIKKGDIITGATFAAKVVKNKVGVPFRTAEFDFMFDTGIRRAVELVEIAASQGVISKRGAFYSYGDQRLGQGKDAAATYLEENPEVSKVIEDQARKMIIGAPATVTAEDDFDAVEDEE